MREAWKQYRGALRKEVLGRRAQIGGHTKHSPSPRSSGGQQYMATADNEDPITEIHQHFEAVFHDNTAEKEMQQLEGLISNMGGNGELRGFSAEEVVRAIGKGKKGKAVGPDGVPTELLQALTQDSSSLQAMVDFFNGILSSGEIPPRKSRT